MEVSGWNEKTVRAGISRDVKKKMGFIEAYERQTRTYTATKEAPNG